MKKSIGKVGLKAKLHDGMPTMIGELLASGAPEYTVDVLAECGTKDLTMIANDTSYPDRGCGRLVANEQVKYLIVSHAGMDPTTAEQINSGEPEVEFSPQGALAERIRVGGCDLGGALTTTGLGIIITGGRKVVNINGLDYFLELPLRTDMVFIKGTAGDETGNLVYKGTTQNFQPLMAMAADCVVVEISELVPVGQISPEAVHTSGIFVDYVFG